MLSLTLSFALSSTAFAIEDTPLPEKDPVNHSEDVVILSYEIDEEIIVVDNFIPKNEELFWAGTDYGLDIIESYMLDQSPNEGHGDWS